MKELEFKEIDHIGGETLDVISDADKFNQWTYDTIEPYCKGKILEIGSGVGNISQFFLQAEASILLSDIRQVYCDELQKKFGDAPSLAGIELLDLVVPDFDQRFAHLLGTFDTVFSLNVVEHIYDDTLAIKNCKKLLKKGGHLIILVPSFQWLYNGLDKDLDHYRRYNKKSLAALFDQNELTIIRKQYFNFMGIFAWFISGKLQKNNTIPGKQMRLYNMFVPLFRWIDKLVFRRAGLSTIVVGKK
ncbi:class I SAM-dependent methyltransferase [Aureispira anguillae]|uniref:Class I SAM-dependent methyltransferase n=1 Tax=Aureispira anguillae TaxID=2864201 RepID=A0A915YIA7_9BACT|nr:class I SAM-dependent methyltransferase [Aureispira anguillae]BDS13708.1 class I SAM-dependent methyltransferase [Aureispira anguillae]